jgi:gliding motility-associated-like protein
MHFINTSAVNLPASINSYLWVFGDGGATSNLKNPVHYYMNHGAYTITLIAITTDGCSGVANNTVKAFDPPTSAFTFSNNCLIDSAVFTNTTVSPTMGSTASWSWNFGDGPALNTTVWSPGHLYTTPGNYTITLITHSSNLGCPDTLQTSLTVFPMPRAKFGFNNVCLNQPTNFSDSSTVASGSIASWSWNFGDSPYLGVVQNPTHTYANPGTYPVTLIVTSSNGCKDTITKNVVVHPLPVAQFSRTNVCDGTAVQFNDLSTILTTDTIEHHIWNLDDNSPLNIYQSPSHLYAAPGSYSVQLLVISSFGCKDSITKTVVVNPNPVVNFTADKKVGCEPLCVNFKDSSTVLTGNNAHYLWNFGDGSPTSTSQDKLHCYVDDSVFSPIHLTVTLTVTSDSGCVTIKSENNYITVYPNPIANFSILPDTASIINPVIAITDLSIGTNYWHWNFGDHDTTSVHNPAPHTYADTGTYRITLITSTLYSCVDSTYKTVTIEPEFLFYIPNAFTPNDDGINDYFSGKGVFIKDYEMIIYDRWGNLIFYTNDINKPWDGTANHGTEIAQRDVYIYTVKITDINRKKHSYKGTVTLER